MWPEPISTAELLARAKAGDPTAIDGLLAGHRAALRRLIDLRIDPALGRRVDASDIVQEVMVEASRRLADYLRDPVMPFHLWLRHLAQDRLIDAHRRHRGAQRRSLDREQQMHAPAGPDRSSAELIGQLLDPERTPASEAIQQEMEKRLNQALAELGPDDREVILMRHFEQLSNQDVAATLGLSEAAASMRYLRALRKLRERLTG